MLYYPSDRSKAMKTDRSKAMKTGRLRGFTLAELLIALGLLGVIAAFTIPKILQAQQDQQRKAIFKETLSTISQVLYEGYQKGQVDGSNYAIYIVNNVNAIKVCLANSQAQGCWSQASPYTLEAYQPGFILANGATVNGLDTPPYTTAFVIDWNGEAGANSEGDDQLYLRICGNSMGSGCGTIKPWTIGPNTTTSTLLYQNIFQ